MLFLHVLWDVVLPIFIVAGAGVLLQRVVHLEPQPLSRAVFYVFSPALAFTGLYSLRVGGEGLLQALALAGSIALVMLLAGLLLARLGRFSRVHRSATLLTLLNSNTGNYGLPLNQFAFGEVGLQFAILFFVLNAVLANSVGVYIASSGRATPGEAVRNVLKTPLVYATVLALLANFFRWPIPSPLYKALSLSGQAAVPVLLVVLGIQLGRLGRNIHWRDALPVTVLKLIVAPVLAWILSGILGMSEVFRAVAVVQSSMPAAVMTTVLSTEFDCEPEYVAEIVFVTTAVSVVTLTVLVSFLSMWLRTH